LPAVIENGVTGYVSNDPDELIARMQELIDNPAKARRLGDNARALAAERFGLDRFRRDWNAAFERVGSRQSSVVSEYVAAATGGQ
jgi:glycosyltransferase involved in cell wall biosynthesis